jgi:hypothetical protein
MKKSEVDNYRDEMIRSLARLETKYDSHVEITKEIRVDVKAQNGRVRSLENRQSWFTGMLAAVTFIFSSLFAFLKGDQ